MTAPVARSGLYDAHTSHGISLRGACYVDLALPVDEIEQGGAKIAVKVETSLAGGAWESTDIDWGTTSGDIEQTGDHRARVELPKAVDAARVSWSVSSGKARVRDVYLLPVFP